MARLVVLADTHVKRGSARRLPDPAYAELERADVVLHAGDVLIPELLHELAGFAPTHAVLGNNDTELFGVLPETWEATIDGVRLAMVHDSGPRAGRERRLKRRFPDADVVVFGHSHIPWNQPGADGQLLFNPGSPIERRMQPRHTIGILELERGRVTTAEIKVVGPA